MPVLFTIETEQVRLVWSRARAQGVPVEPEPAGRPFGLAVEALQAGVVPVEQFSSDGTRHLFEQTGYVLFVRSRTEAPVAVRHRDPALLRGLHSAEGGRVVHGTVNFGSQVGQSRFVIEVAGRLHLAFEVEVFPSKLDYRQDYVALRDEVQDIATSLVLAYLRSTFQYGALMPGGLPGVPGWIALLQHVMGELEGALHYIAQHPRWGTVWETQEARTEHIRRCSTALRRAVQQGAGRGVWQRVQGGPPVRSWLPERPARYTLDTPEHRWLAAQLAYLRRRLAVLHEEEARYGSGRRRDAVQQALQALQRRLTRLLQRLPGEEDGADEAPPAPTLRLLTAPGYREAHRACLVLRQGLSLHGEAVRVELKDLHLLYEYWCFLVLVKLAAAETGQPLPARRLLAVERQGLRVRLRKGRSQSLTFHLSDGGRLVLTYSPRFGGRGYLVSQQPDIALTRYTPSGASSRYILDAKYRLDASAAYRQRYGVPGPPAAVLNDLHRYRDAVLDRSRRRRTVVQALALFPYREETPGAFAESRYGRALEEVGVGAIPLLPGATDHLRAWLRRVLV